MKTSVDEILGFCAHDVPLTPRGNAPLQHAYPCVPQTPKPERVPNFKRENHSRGS